MLGEVEFSECPGAISAIFLGLPGPRGGHSRTRLVPQYDFSVFGTTQMGAWQIGTQGKRYEMVWVCMFCFWSLFRYFQLGDVKIPNDVQKRYLLTLTRQLDSEKEKFVQVRFGLSTAVIVNF